MRKMRQRTILTIVVFGLAGWGSIRAHEGTHDDGARDIRMVRPIFEDRFAVRIGA